MDVGESELIECVRHKHVVRHGMLAWQQAWPFSRTWASLQGMAINAHAFPGLAGGARAVVALFPVCCSLCASVEFTGSVLTRCCTVMLQRFFIGVRVGL